VEEAVGTGVFVAVAVGAAVTVAVAVAVAVARGGTPPLTDKPTVASWPPAFAATMTPPGNTETVRSTSWA
jgi:hypothetical protein